MATLVTMPKLGMTMEEGTVHAWFKAEGDSVAEGEPLLSVLTDKVDIEVDAPASGVLRKILVPVGETVPINTPIAVIAGADEDISGLLAADRADGAALGVSSTGAAPAAGRSGGAEAGAAGHAPTPGGASAGGASPGVGPGPGTSRAQAAPPAGEKVRATPVARRLAAAWGLDLAAIAGTGPKGRVTRADVEEFAARHGALAAGGPAAVALGPAGAAAPVPGPAPHAVQAAPLASPITPAPPAAPPSAPSRAGTPPAAAREPGLPAAGAPQRLPLSAMRRVIGQRMAQSAFTAPHVTLHTEADVTELVRLREQLDAAHRRQGGTGVTYTDLLVYMAARALTEHPLLNARLEGDELVLEPEVHVGLAVAVNEGLVVPVIRSAARRRLGDIARERHRLVAAAREGQLSLEDVEGGTFTITNLGPYDIDGFTPIINPPQTAILGVGRIVQKPVVRRGKVRVRAMMALSLSFDHRVVDGAPAAAFLQRIKQLGEEPAQLLL